MVEKKPVNVGVQVIFCIIPYLWIYGFYRIEKLRMAVVLIFATVIPSVFFQMILPFPYGLASALILGFILPIVFIVHWSREWNERVSRGYQEEEQNNSPKSPLSILQARYARGEITKEEFEKMKEDLS